MFWAVFCLIFVLLLWIMNGFDRNQSFPVFEYAPGVSVCLPGPVRALYNLHILILFRRIQPLPWPCIHISPLLRLFQELPGKNQLFGFVAVKSNRPASFFV